MHAGVRWRLTVGVVTGLSGGLAWARFLCSYKRKKALAAMFDDFVRPGSLMADETRPLLRGAGEHAGDVTPARTRPLAWPFACRLVVWLRVMRATAPGGYEMAACGCRAGCWRTSMSSFPGWLTR